MKGDVLIHCMAGRGRTGLFVSSLMGVMDQLDYPLPEGASADPIDWLRNNYDMDVVESVQQLSYVKALGISTICEPSDAKSKYPYNKPNTPSNLHKSDQSYFSKFSPKKDDLKGDRDSNYSLKGYGNY